MFIASHFLNISKTKTTKI